MVAPVEQDQSAAGDELGQFRGLCDGSTWVVAAAGQAGADPLDGSRRFGIDEVAYRKGRRCLTVVVDHDTGRLVWARAGRNKATVTGFFDALGPHRAAALTHVSADAGQVRHQVDRGHRLQLTPARPGRTAQLPHRVPPDTHHRPGVHRACR